MVNGSKIYRDVLWRMTLTACSDDNKCGMCNGLGHSDYDPYEIMDDVYGK